MSSQHLLSAVDQPLKFTLYGIPSTASMIPRILLAELLHNTNQSNQLHEVQIVNLTRSNQDLKSDKYLKLNPQGIVPTLVVELKSNNSSDDPIVIYETLAICYFLCDLFQGNQLEPARNDFKKRALYHQWMSLICNALQGDSYHYFYPHRYVNSQSNEEIERIKKETEERMFEKFKIFEKELSDGRDYIMGSGFTVVDIYLFVVASWTRGFKHLKATNLPNMNKYMERIFSRELVNEIVKLERDSEPLY